MLTRDEVTTKLKQQLHERFAPEFPNNPEALKQKLWDVMYTFCSEDPPDSPEQAEPAGVAYTHLATAFIEYFKHTTGDDVDLVATCDNLLFLADAVLIEVFDKRMPRERMDEFNCVIPAE
jgi:hypothetical protein